MVVRLEEKEVDGLVLEAEENPHRKGSVYINNWIGGCATDVLQM